MTEQDAQRRVHDFRGTHTEAQALCDDLNPQLDPGCATLVPVDFGSLGHGIMLATAAEEARRIGVLPQETK